jgi:chemotaxis protein methyltransferase CheR
MTELRKPVSSLSSLRPSSALGLPTRDGGAREFSFSAADFERVRALIYQHAGISLSPVKQDMVYSRLARRLRATGMQSFSEYLNALEKDGGDEWERFVNSLTTNLTSFFRTSPFPNFCRTSSKNRHQASCPYLVFSGIDRRGALFNCDYSSRNIWEQYLAYFHRGIGSGYQCAGKCPERVYPIERVEKLSPERLRKFFLKGTGSQEGFVSVRPELKQMIQFQRINLLTLTIRSRGLWILFFVAMS